MFAFRRAVAVAWIATPSRTFAVKVTAEMVKELRVATGAPMMECKAALSDPDVNGELAAAMDWLRKKGVMAASKKAGRIAGEGLIGLATSTDGNSAALVEVCLCLATSLYASRCGAPPCLFAC